jgi:hypothetical protein
MARLGGTVFVDDFETSQSTPSHSITFEGENLEVITLDAYPAASPHGHVMVSSENPTTILSGNNDLFSRTFVPKAKFTTPPVVQSLM